VRRVECAGEPHHQCLEMHCAEALQRGDPDAAYRLADRRCRIRPLPDAHCFVLRAEALYRIGERAAAIEDLEAALEIAPEDLAVNRRMLNWGNAIQRRSAARALISCEHDFRILRRAVGCLHKSGAIAFANVTIRNDLIEGWAAWQARQPICVAIADESSCREQYFEGDRWHPLATELGNAVSFRLSASATAYLISVATKGNILCELPLGNQYRPLPSTPRRAPSRYDGTVTIIVPVYGDLSATRACLESLFAQRGASGRHQVILVNDASPDPGIVQLLGQSAKSKQVRLLTNPRNLGFVGAVNRALQEVSAGDVILLNADTIVPENFVERLALVAHASADIGTVTPLSNNGEFTSFPVPNQASDAGNAEEVSMLDRIAARVNAGKIVDIPNGIGFCLYITRACLDAVGLLSRNYSRGYLEDVDFCLRARLYGFRNVCAPSVYVGHAGSRSFGRQKRVLVVRNLRVIEAKFPTYRSECADFVLADPLKASRRALELSLLSSFPHRVLLVTPAGSAAEVAHERARQFLSEEGLAALILEIRHQPGHLTALLHDGNGGVPQSLEFSLPAGNPADLLEVLRMIPLKRIEIFDHEVIPRSISDALRQLGVAFDVCLLSNSNPIGHRDLIAQAERILVSDAQAEAAAALFKHTCITRLAETVPRLISPLFPAKSVVTRLGLLPTRRCMQELHFMRELIVPLRRAQPGLEIVVAGQTSDDAAFNRTGAFVTGLIEADELNAIFRRYRLDRIVCCATRPLFGHPLVAAAMAGSIPAAFPDWSRGACRTRDGDLALDAPMPAAHVVAQLVPWLAGVSTP